MKHQHEPMFNVGDVVRIVETPYNDCPFLWIETMSDMCGNTVTIASVEWNLEHSTHLYRIEEDNGDIAWCQNCFMPIEADIPEADGDMALLLS